MRSCSSRSSGWGIDARSTGSRHRGAGRRDAGDLLNDAGFALSRSRVLCLGAAYKPGVADVRESPDVEVMRQLRRKGAVVSYADPHVPSLVLDLERLTSVDLADALAEVDAVVVLTPHTEFDLDLVRREAPLVLDTRAAVEPGERVFRL